MSIFDAVREAYSAGLSVIPPAQDGTKRPFPPGGGGWKGYQSNRPTLALLSQWYDPKNGLTGIGIACGKVSGNVEAIDFDTREAWEEYRHHAELCGVAPLVERIWAGYGEESPRGAHLLYRCSEVAGNQKLAMDETGKKAMIETRGEGGYIIIAPSNGKVHPSGGAYRKVSGSLSTIAEISTVERKDLIELAKSLCRKPNVAPRFEPSIVGDPAASKPGEDFNRRATWPQILEPHGWRRVYERGGVTYWRRPDKREGVSASTGYAGTDYLYVFSTSTGFDSERGYTKYAAHAVLNCAGDFKAAARDLAKSGFGDQESGGNRVAKRGQMLPNGYAEAPATPAEAPEFKEFLSLADFIAAPPASTYLIKGILPGRGLAQVFGSSNVGKSFLVIDIAMHVASGMSWRGFKTKRAPVLYIAAEGLSGLAGRMKAWTQRNGDVPEHFWIRPLPAELTVKGMAAVLADKISELPQRPRLIILDTLAANFGPGSENDAEDMALALSGLRSLGGDWLVMCVHHSGHQDKERSRGHSSLFGALDVELRVSRDDPSGPIKLEHTKVRDGTRLKEPLYFQIQPESLPWADEDGEPVNSAVLAPCAGLDTVEEGGRGPAPLGSKQARALAALRAKYSTQFSNMGYEGTPRVLLKDWYDAMEFERDRSHKVRIKNDLEKRGYITCENGYVYIS